MDMEADEVKEESKYSLVLSVIDSGFSETLMAAARSAGARGGTIINARRAGLEEAVKFFGVTLQEEKELVAIVVHERQKRELMNAIAQKCGINTTAHGIVISMPVEACAGIDFEQSADA